MKLPRLPLKHLRDLSLVQASRPGAPAFLSAASGLVQIDSKLYVVADDELHLGCFGAKHSRPGNLIRLLDGDLPLRKKRRKKLKPDLEVLLRLPASPQWRQGALLALGSGSGRRRRKAVILPLDAAGRVRSKQLQVLNAEPLFDQLKKVFDDLNLEGGWVHAGRLHLLQRGNREGVPNALIDMPLAPLLRTAVHEAVLPKAEIKIKEFKLGSYRGVPLTFTDASPNPKGGWLFSAVAEDTDNSYSDGRLAGAILGVVSAEQKVTKRFDVGDQHKIEGIDVSRRGRKLQVLCVTDADDPAVPARLLETRL